MSFIIEEQRPHYLQKIWGTTSYIYVRMMLLEAKYSYIGVIVLDHIIVSVLSDPKYIFFAVA